MKFSSAITLFIALEATTTTTAEMLRNTSGKHIGDEKSMHRRAPIEKDISANKVKNFKAEGNNDNNSGIDTRTLIVNGTQSEIGEFPYFVDLDRNGTHRCGGSLIAPNVVLSAAHCDESGQYFIGEEVFVGGYSNNGIEDHGEQAVRVDHQIVHPQYDSSSNMNDFQLLLLGRPVQIDKPRLSLSRDGGFYSPQVGTDLRVIGVGTTSSGGQLAPFLEDVNVSVVDVDQCNARYSNALGWNIYGDTMFCAGDINDGGEDSCQGDSGGPIFIEQSEDIHVQVGVVSFGERCGNKNYPGVYAKVGVALPWIREVVCIGWNIDAEFCDDKTECADLNGWLDFYGDNCSWYESSDSPGCPEHGNSFRPASGILPNDACCYCGGGECSDLNGWVDRDGLGCSWYESNDSPGCPLHGNSFIHNATGIAPKEACCYCGGGL